MRGFYDNMLPKEIGKYVKQWGGKVEQSAITTPRGKPTQYEDFAAYNAAEKRSQTPIWRVDITPDMRKLAQAGQASFMPEVDYRGMHTAPGSDEFGYDPQKTKLQIRTLIIEEEEKRLGRKLTDKEKSDIIKSIRNPK